MANTYGKYTKELMKWRQTYLAVKTNKQTKKTEKNKTNAAVHQLVFVSLSAGTKQEIADRTNEGWELVKNHGSWEMEKETLLVPRTRALVTNLPSEAGPGCLALKGWCWLNTLKALVPEGWLKYYYTLATTSKSLQSSPWEALDSPRLTLLCCAQRQPTLRRSR